MSTLACDNESAPAGAGNTTRGLTHSSDFSREGLAMKATRTCIVDGCEKGAIARGWCTAHWTRWKRHGDPLAGGASRSPAPSSCTIDGCEEKPRARGLCVKHWRADMAATNPEWHEGVLAKRREWHAENPELVAEARRRSSERNREANLARLVKWRSENRHQTLLDNWLRRRRAHGLPENVVNIVHPDVIFERDSGICQICGHEVDDSLAVTDPMSATVDHIVPVIDPASEHSYANTQLAHFDCNRRKSAKEPA